ncbi:MAG: hypothetical protein GC208_00820 [Alphaproteobacteria bacterium]|nr:hypothetical protein [Alphaproteobacteria bacterium]
MRRAVDDAVISWCAAPLDWLRLAARFKFSVPAALRRAVERETEEPVDLAPVVAAQKREIASLRGQLARVGDGDLARRLSGRTQQVRTLQLLVKGLASQCNLYREDGTLARNAGQRVAAMIAKSGNEPPSDTTLMTHLRAAWEAEIPEDPL